MKKIISAISLLLVFSMVAVMCCSCANIFISQEALASISERILEGVNKISVATALDAQMKIKASMSVNAMSFISIELPAKATARFNITDKNNPSAYFDMGLDIDESQISTVIRGADFFGASNLNMSFYYSDGYTYTSGNFGEEKYNTKMKTDVDEFSSLPALNFADMRNLVFFDESMIKSASLKNGRDGSLTAKVTVDGKKASVAVIKLLCEIFDSDSESENNDDYYNSIYESDFFDFDKAEVSITVDKDNNATNFKLNVSVNAKLNEEYSAKLGLDLDVDFAVVGEDYVVPAPADLDSYKEIDFSDYGKNDPFGGDDIVSGDEATLLYGEDDFSVYLSSNGGILLCIIEDSGADGTIDIGAIGSVSMYYLFGETVDTLFDENLKPNAHLLEIVDSYRN